MEFIDLPRPEEPEQPEDPKPTTDLVVQGEGLGGILVKHSQEAGVPVDKKQYDIISSFMERAQHGHQAALPMKCRGTSCKFLGMCPLYEASMKLPEGERCPVEKSVLEMWVQKTIHSLDIDPDNPEYAVDLDMVYELAGMELLRMRAAHHLHESPALVDEKIVGYSPQGQPIYDEKPAMPLLILERYAKVIAKLREALLATRKSQAMAGQMAGDTSVRTATIMERARKIAEKRRSGGKLGDVEDAEFTVHGEQEEDTES